MIPGMPRRVVVGSRSLVALAICLLAVLAALLPMPDVWVERIYSQEIYLWLQGRVTPLSNRVPFAVIDLLLVVVLGGLVSMSVRVLGPGGRGRRLRRLWRVVARTGPVIGAVYLVFLLMWGLNYRRVPLREKLDFDDARVTGAALAALADAAVRELNVSYPLAVEQGWPNLSALPDMLGPAFQAVQQRLGSEPMAIVGRPKRSILTFYFQRSAIDGMIDPFFLEVLVNDDVLPFERPFVTAHEWAHLAGYASEAEASFVGWLTCLQGSIGMRYSGWLMMYAHAVRQMPREERDAIRAALDPGPREHLEAVAARVSRATPTVRRAARRVYDRFLKANRLRAGVASYDEVVTLLLGTRFEPGWRPVER